jgi:predicted nucleic acid-binding protein
MPVVVDASALAAMVFGEAEGRTIAAHLERETLIAPSLIDYELVNVALKRARRNPGLAVEIGLSLAAALQMPLTRVAVPGLDVLVLASETGLTAYDAAYLWLARSRDCELVTLDKGLARITNNR